MNLLDQIFIKLLEKDHMSFTTFVFLPLISLPKQLIKSETFKCQSNHSLAW